MYVCTPDSNTAGRGEWQMVHPMFKLTQDMAHCNGPLTSCTRHSISKPPDCANCAKYCANINLGVRVKGSERRVKCARNCVGVA